MKTKNPFYLKGEAHYSNDHREAPLSEGVKDVLKRAVDNQTPIATEGHTISISRVFAYLLGNKRPSDTLHAELERAYH